MSQKLTVQCWEPVQAHKAMTAQIWPMLKSMLMAGHRMVLELKPVTRSLEQNAKMWACLTDISKQVNWYGNTLSPDDWKHVLSASLRKQRAVPGIDGGFVVVGLQTSQMTIAEMSEMIELAHAFGADKGVLFHD
jgi:hypothetical protein